MTDKSKTTPLPMRLLRACGLWIMDMDMQAPWGRAQPGERWACLCGSLLGRGIMWPLWRVNR